MTGFPIAVGTGPRHSSSRPFPQDGQVIMAMGMNDGETLAATVFISYNFHPIDNTAEEPNEIDAGDSDEEINDRNAAAAAPLSASLSVDDNHHFNVIAELRVQISHSASPLVSNTDAMSNRETKSRVPLGIMKKRRRSGNRTDDKTQQLFIPAASVIFSSSQSHLACLIPVPTGYDLISNASQDSSQISTNESVSTIVIFNIQTYSISSRQQTRQQNRKLPKLPDFILDQTTNNDDKTIGGKSNTLQNDGDNVSITSERQSNDSKSQNVHVAHAPKIVRVAPEGASSESDVHLPSLQSATCICNVPSDSNNGKGHNAFSTLLVGVTDGSMLIIDFETARVKDILYEQKQMNRVTSPIIHLSQCPPTLWKPHNKYGDELGSVSKGRISAVTRDGGISIFSTSFHGVSEHQSSNIDQSRSFVNKSGLIMEIEPLAQFHPSDTNNSSNVSGLRYACAKWLNPLLLAVLTRSPLLDEDFSGQQSNALCEIVVAQVWSVTEVQADNPEQTLSKANICVLSELKFPCENSLVELAHGTFSLSQESESEAEASFGKSYLISYNSHRDCLALSSQLVLRDRNAKDLAKMRVRPFCISWDWKRNAQGLTLISDVSLLYEEWHAQLNGAGMPSIFSHFLVSNDCAIHFYEKRHAQRKRLHKDIYNLSTLSPSHVSRRGSNVRLCEVSPLMLGGDVITYPLLSQPLATSDVSLRWEESRIPSSYVAANGPCRIAAIGKDRGRSIAVAASRGLCILDLSRISWQASDLEGNEIATPCVKSNSDIGSPTSQLTPLCPQWKLFSNMNDEQQFRVVSFLWWESSTDDFILAVVQYVTSDVPHLVCWSHRRLGFGESQLLIDQNEYISKRNEGAKPFSTHGLSLPNGFRVDSMSILKDPAGSDRALLLLSSISSDDKSCGIDYALYQLQTKKQSSMASERVVAKLSAHGSIPYTVGTVSDICPTDSITGVFLAGGSLLFDLNTDPLESEYDSFGVIGITSLCLDLCVACVNHKGPILYKPSLLEQSNVASDSAIGTKKSIVASYWISDLTCPGRIVWNIAQNDGKVYCWAAPCYSNSSPALSQMTFVSTIGETCHLGRSSLWQNGSTLNGSEVALGPFLSAHFSCTMYCGQSSRTIRLQSDIKAILSFHVGNCVITAPHYTPSLFLSFLNLAKQDPTSSKSQPNRSDSIEKSYIRMILLKARSKNNGSSRSALRIIILKVVELLDESKGNNDKIHKWNEGMSILREVVSVAREIFDELSFASFFLSVGRQLEPHQFDLIFPLPLEGGVGISAEDLFMVAVKRGSMSVALSGLALFTCHEETQNRVVQLLCHCLFRIDEVFTLSSLSSEEDTFLHQLYWFGVKLEDAIIAEQAQEESTNMFDSIDSGESAIMSNSFTSFDESSIGYASNGDYSIESSEDSSRAFPLDAQDDSFISCRSQKRKPREGLVTKVVSRLFQSSRPPKHNSFEEDAIYEAATSFIISGFDYDDEAITSTASNAICNVETHHDDDSFDTPLISVAGSTCAFLSHVIGFNYKPESKAGGWVIASKIACLIQGDRETLAISHAAASNAVRVSRLVTVDELRDVCTFDQFIHSESATQQSHSTVALFLEHLTSHCCDEIHSNEAVESILNLVLLLLLRHDTCEDVQLHRGKLILIGIVCGHRSGRITDLIGLMSQDCDVHLIYQAFTQQ